MDNDRIDYLITEFIDRIMGVIHWVACKIMGDA